MACSNQRVLREHEGIPSEGASDVRENARQEVSLIQLVVSVHVPCDEEILDLLVAVKAAQLGSLEQQQILEPHGKRIDINQIPIGVKTENDVGGIDVAAAIVLEDIGHDRDGRHSRGK